MHVEDPRWDDYENRFRALAGRVTLQKGPQAEAASAELMLCLYGDNGLSSEQEFEVLARLEQAEERLRGTEVVTAYWEDVLLYLP